MFSVIIPVHNGQNTLGRAVDSVLQQTCKDFELLIVDDGSTDDSLKIAQNHMDGRVRCISQRNQGVSAARNQGISQAQGKLITFLDADDEWFPIHLETMWWLYQAAGQIDALYATTFFTILPNKCREHVSLRLAHDILPEEQWRVYNDYFSIVNRSIHGYDAYNTNNVMLPGTVLSSVDHFPAGCKIGEDIDLWNRILLDYPAVLMNRETSVYHREESTATGGIDYNVDWPFLTTVDKRLADNAIRPEIVESVAFFCDRVRIRNARHLLMNGHKKAAVDELRKLRNARGQGQNLLITLALLPLPAAVIKKGFLKRHPGYYKP